MKDLIILAACSQIEHSVSGILSRPHRLQIRQVSHDIFVHFHFDSGCYREAHEFLRSQRDRYRHSLVVFDYKDCGHCGKTIEQVEGEIEVRLTSSGWDDRSRAVAISPELEAWVWSDSPVVDQACGWSGRIPSLRQWIRENGFDCDESGKPFQPKEAFDSALKRVGKTRSSAIFREIASKISFQRCVDRSFTKLLACLRTWFGNEPMAPAAMPP